MVLLDALPDDIWSIVLAYLTPEDMRNLLKTSREVKRRVEPYIYHELTLTEWASSGARLARAILEGTVSDSIVKCIEKVRVEFTSMDEISEVLQLIVEIHPQMRGLREIDIDSYHTEDALTVIDMLSRTYTQISVWGASARSPVSWPSATASNALSLLTSLRFPRLFRHEIDYLTRVSCLELDEISEDGSSAVFVLPDGNAKVLDRLVMPYHSYVQIGAPPSVYLELSLCPNDLDIEIKDPVCSTLRIVATEDLPNIRPQLQTPSLRALVLCNIFPLPVVKLFENSNLSTVEFISLAPVTIPALQALFRRPNLSALRLVVCVVLPASFPGPAPWVDRRRARKLVEWLQMLASQYPVDVRDPKHLLNQDIYFSDGLWCLASQTQYCWLLPLVSPPPLK